MQGSQEGKRAKLFGPRAHFGANISMKIEEFVHYSEDKITCKILVFF